MKFVLRGLIVLLAACVSAPAIGQSAGPLVPTRDAPQIPAASEDVRKACVSHHANGQIARRAGKLLEARENWLMCLHMSCPEAVRSDCTDWYTEVDRLIPSLILEARSDRGDEANVHVSMDGKTLTDQLDGKPIDVDPGKHQLRFELPSYPPVNQTVLLSEGQKRRVLSIIFVNPSRPQPVTDTTPKHRPIPQLTYFLLGGAVLATGNGVYWTVRGFQDRNALANSCQPFCPRSEVQELRTTFLIADVSFATAALLGGSALYVYLTRPEKQREEPSESSPKPARSSLGLRPGAQAATLELWSEF